MQPTFISGRITKAGPRHLPAAGTLANYQQNYGGLLLILMPRASSWMTLQFTRVIWARNFTSLCFASALPPDWAAVSSGAVVYLLPSVLCTITAVRPQLTLSRHASRRRSKRLWACPRPPLSRRTHHQDEDSKASRPQRTLNRCLGTHVPFPTPRADTPHSRPNVG